VIGDLRPLVGVCGAARSSPVIDMQVFMTFGLLHHLQGRATRREQLEGLLQL
jgi:hypothetical protein